MTKPVAAIEADTPLTEAADLFMQKMVGRFLVTSKERPVGTISLSDFVASLSGRIKSKRETVGDVMSDAILVCRGKTSVLSAARAMTSSGWRSVLVVDAKGKVLGEVSGHDLLKLVKDGVNEKMIVRDVMHPALTIDIHASLREAADMLIKNHYHRLVVTDKENRDAFPLGVISTFDIVAEMARPDSGKTCHYKSFLAARQILVSIAAQAPFMSLAREKCRTRVTSCRASLERAPLFRSHFPSALSTRDCRQGCAEVAQAL